MLSLENTDDQSKHILLDIIVQHAQIGFNFLVQYCETHTFYHQSPIQLFCTVHICDALTRYNSDDRATAEVVDFGLRSLEEAQVAYPIAGILRDSFRQAVSERRLTLPAKTRQQLDEKSPYLPHDIRNAFTRSTYQQPIAQMLPVLDDYLGCDFAKQLAQRSESDPATAHSDEDDRSEWMQIGSVLN